MAVRTPCIATRISETSALHLLALHEDVEARASGKTSLYKGKLSLPSSHLFMQALAPPPPSQHNFLRSCDQLLSSVLSDAGGDHRRCADWTLCHPDIVLPKELPFLQHWITYICAHLLDDKISSMYSLRVLKPPGGTPAGTPNSK